MVTRPYFFAIVLAGLACSQGQAVERFSLDVPGQPELRSTATADRNTLVITDATGRSYTYQRDKAADSRDGVYWAYYNADLRRWIRFPENGAGAMQYAERDRTRAWQTSKMRVTQLTKNGVPIGGAASGRGGGVMRGNPFGTGVLGGGRRGGGDPFTVGGRPRGGDPFAVGRHAHHASHFAVLPVGRDFHLCSFDRRGDLQFYTGHADRWQHQALHPTRGIDFDGSFVLAPDPRSDVPIVYGISSRGELLAITNGRDVRDVFGGRPDHPHFVRNTHLTTFDNGRLILAVDDRARCLLIVGSDGRYVDAGPFRARAVPGSPAYAVRDATDTVHVFLIDRDGQLVQLTRDRFDRWDDRIVARGYAPGGDLTVNQLRIAGRAAEAYVAAIDSRGVPQILREPFQRGVTVTAAKFQPGSPLAVAQNQAGALAFAAVGPRGTLAEWSYGDRWTQRTIGNGFEPGAPVWYQGGTPACFAINRQGALISGYYDATGWACHTCGTIRGLAGYVPPRVVSQEIVPLPALPPVEIELRNRHKEDLVIQWYDALNPAAKPATIEIKAGASVKQRLDRNAGAKRVESVAVQRLDGTVVEEVREYQIPAQANHTLAVYENRVQSVYIDRTGKDPNAGSVTKGLRSLGVFRLPPGELLRDGAVINVYEEAASRRNAGAVRLLP